MNKPDLNLVVKFKLFGYEFIVRKFVPLKEIRRHIKKEEGKKKGYRMCPVMAKRMMTREQAVEQRDRTKAAYIRVYMCEFCNTWHLTHKKKFNTL